MHIHDVVKPCIVDQAIFINFKSMSYPYGGSDLYMSVQQNKITM